MPQPPSFIEGGPLPDLGVKSLVELLPRAAELNPHKAICHLGEDGTETWKSYAELLDDASRVLTGIRRSGVRAGDRVVLQVADEPDLLVAFWACVLGGFVPVPVSARGSSSDVVENVSRALNHPWTLTGSDRGTSSLGTVASLRRNPADHDWAASDWDDLAVMVLTAGSSGAPKAVMLSHGNILSRSAGTAAANGLTSASTTFNWMPLDHVSGLVMFHVRDVFLACKQIHARKEWVLADPTRWLDAIDRYRADTTWATNSSFDVLSDRVEGLDSSRWDLSCLRYVMNGGEAVKARTIRRFLTALAPFGLPTTAMRPGWGMSETSAGIVDHRIDLDSVRDDDRFVPVGKPHPGASVRVVDDADRIVPEGTIGYLQVSGFPITTGYYRDDEQNQRSFTADGWLRTGDLALVDNGDLVVTGSADDAIPIDGRVHHGHEIESVVAELPFVEKIHTVACLVRNPVTGAEELAIFCHLDDSVDAEVASAAIRDIVRTRCGLEATHVVPMAKEEIPMTVTGKPKRAELRKIFLRQ